MSKILQTIIWVAATGGATYLLMLAVSPSEERMRKVLNKEKIGQANQKRTAEIMEVMKKSAGIDTDDNKKR